MDVAPSHRDVMKRSDVVVDCDGDTTNHDDGSKESYGSEKKPFSASLRELALVNRPQPRPSNNQDEYPQNDGDNERPNPKTLVRPRHSNVILVHGRSLTYGINESLRGVKFSLSSDDQSMIENRFGCDWAYRGDLGAA
jgi:hypothetical protein